MSIFRRVQLRYKTIIFDLDGTISDPFVGISRSINFALEALDHPAVDPEQVRPLIGPPLTEIFEFLLGPLPGTKMDKLIDLYRDRYARVGYAENRLYDDIPDIIESLSRTGYVLGVCTSKRGDYARRIIEMFGLSQYFSFVDGGAGMDKRQQIRLLVRNGVVGDSAIMVGDRAMDIDAGKSNALASAGVLWGFGEKNELVNADPDYILETPAELLRLLIE